MKRIFVSLLLVLTLVMSSICCVNAAQIGTVDWFKTQFLSTNTALNTARVEDVDVPVTIKVKLNSESATSYASSLTAPVGTVVDLIAELDMTRVKDLVAIGQTTMNSNFSGVSSTGVSGKFVINADWTNVLKATPGSLSSASSMDGFKFYYENNGNYDEIQGQTIFVEDDSLIEETISNGNVVGVKRVISIANGTTVGEVLALPDKITLEHTGLEVVGYGNINGSFDVVDYADGTQLAAIESKTHTKLDFNDGGRYVKYIFQVTSANINMSSQPTGGGSSAKKYTLSYESNGGTEFTKESYAKGQVVKLNKIPVKEGYIFDGWYADAELTEKIDSIKIGEDTTVYAGWVKEAHPVPEMLNGDEHFAYINGYADGTVRPNSNITRAEVATIFFRLLKDDVREKYLTKENVFEDVNEGDWYNTAVSTMANAGVVNGRFEGVFAPDEYITRAEFTTICARFDEANSTIDNIFTDIDLHWASEYILEAVAYGWVEGYEDYTFRPDQFIERAEAITLINRVLNRIPRNKAALLDGMMTWSDNSDESAWYYVAIQEAANSHKYTREETGYETWTELTEARDWTVYEK